MRAWLLVAALVAAAACDDEDAPARDGGPLDAGLADGGAPDAGVSRLERPGLLPRPPAGRLPPELIPPGR